MSELLVPTRADAIWLQRATRVAGPTSDYERLPWFDGRRDHNGSVAHIAAAINALPFNDHQAWLEAGVHLHWSLPDGLTRGSTRRSPHQTVLVGDLWFAPAPNRWLVLRRSFETRGATPIQRAWLVESDYVHPAGTRPRSAIAYPRQIAANGKAPYFHLGRQIELNPETMVASDPATPAIAESTSLASHGPLLTALGPGDPMFAASYPCCRSVFGLHDDKPAIGELVMYATYGWYSEDVIEPLATLNESLFADQTLALSLLNTAAHADKTDPPDPDKPLTAMAWKQAFRLLVGQRLGWSFDVNERLEVPTRIVCTAATTIKAGQQATETAKASAPAPAGDSQVGIGSSPAEAVAALLMPAEQPLNQDDENRLVQSLAATDLANHPLDLGLKLAEARHTEQFRPSRGHSIWMIRPPDSPTGSDAHSAVALPEQLAHELNLLNELQQAYDRAQDGIASLRQAVFADWCLYMSLAYPEGDADPFEVDLDALRELTDRTRLSPLEALQYRTGQIYHGRDSSGKLLIADRHPQLQSGPLAHGPVVGELSESKDGDLFVDRLPDAEPLSAVIVWSGSIVDDIQLIGQKTTLPRRTRGGNRHELRLHAGEHLSAMFGEYGNWFDNQLLTQLGFETSHGRRFGPWGSSQDGAASFRISCPDAMAIAGFQGRSGNYLNALGMLVAPLVATAPARQVARDTSASAVVDQFTILDSLLDEASAGGQALTLGPAPGPRFWRPHDPVIALADPMLQTGPRHGQDGRDRPDGQHRCFAHRLTTGWDNNGAAFAGAKRAPLSTRGDKPWGLAQHPLFFSRSEGENWHAMELEWEVELRPLRDGGNVGNGRFNAGFVTQSQTLPAEGADLVGKAGLARSRHYHYLSGRSILNPSAWRLMAQRLGDIPQTIRDQLLTTPTSLMVLPLGGFHDQLLMQRHELQLPITDPIGLPGQREFARRVREAIGPLHPTTAMPDSPFYPIRSGDLVIERLRVIDSFGRSRIWRPHKLSTTARMRPSETESIGDHAVMPLRLAQAARLDFRWLSAIDATIESNAHPASSPICGWLLPNDLDGEIAVHSHTGHLLGSVAAGGKWQPAPGNATAPRSWREIDEPAIRRIVRWISEPSNGDATGTFLDVLDLALARIDPKDSATHQARSLLIGRPIAIVRARLALSLQHPAALDLSMQALRNRLSGGDDNDHGLSAVEIPVRLGEHAQLDDGLCGYWIEQTGEFRDDCFYTPHGIQSPKVGHQRIRVMGDGPLTNFPLRLTPDGPAALLTMLIDPRGAVHATCGILPTKSIRVPVDQYAAQAHALRATFIAAPILSAADDLALPLPNEPGFAWSWLERDADRWLEIPQHPTLHKAELIAGFGTVGAALWDRLLTLGRIVSEDHPDVGLLMPGQANAPTDRFNDLGLDPETVERGLHQLAQAISAAGTDARFGPRAVARDGWLQLRQTAAPIKTAEAGEVKTNEPAAGVRK